MVIPVFSLAHDYYAAFCLQFLDRFLARLKCGVLFCFFFTIFIALCHVMGYA